MSGCSIYQKMYVNTLAGKINRLVNDRSFKKYLKGMSDDEGEATEGDEPDADEGMDDKDMDALFMERM